MPYEQDSSRQWRYFDKNQRYKAVLKTCPVCQKTFPTREVQPAKRCSWTCSNRTNAKTQALKRTGPRSHLWKGGRHFKEGGYVRLNCPEHPASTNNTVLEHRLVMEKHLGRYLTAEETVHHKNRIRHDNRLENLELWSGKHPPGSRVRDLIVWAKDLLERYGNDESKY